MNIYRQPNAIHNTLLTYNSPTTSSQPSVIVDMSSDTVYPQVIAQIHHHHNRSTHAINRLFFSISRAIWTFFKGFHWKVIQTENSTLFLQRRDLANAISIKPLACLKSTLQLDIARDLNHKKSEGHIVQTIDEIKRTPDIVLPFITVSPITKEQILRFRPVQKEAIFNPQCQQAISLASSKLSQSLKAFYKLPLSKENESYITHMEELVELLNTHIKSLNAFSLSNGVHTFGLALLPTRKNASEILRNTEESLRDILQSSIHLKSVKAHEQRLRVLENSAKNAIEIAVHEIEQEFETAADRHACYDNRRMAKEELDTIISQINQIRDQFRTSGIPEVDTTYIFQTLTRVEWQGAVNVLSKNQAADTAQSRASEIDLDSIE